MGAARAGVDDAVYPLNDENSRDKANFVGQKGNDIYEYTAPVRKFDANKNVYIIGSTPAEEVPIAEAKAVAVGRSAGG